MTENNSSLLKNTSNADLMDDLLSNPFGDNEKIPILQTQEKSRLDSLM